MNCICTWFYGEHKGNESHYGQVGGVSSSTEFYRVYLECVYVFYYMALKTNPDARYVFFTNLQDIPEKIGKIPFKAFFEKNNIEIVHRELSFKTPKEWFGAWRNQFYVFDVLQWLGENAPDERIIILDSDCLITKNLKEAFAEIEENKLISYDLRKDCGYDNDRIINGTSINDMRDICKDIYGKSDETVIYCGGEWIGIHGSVIPRLMSLYHEVSDKNYQRFEAGKKKLTEEAHMLSALYYGLGLIDWGAGKYIKRMWTSTDFVNTSGGDTAYPIWHMPSEKKYGFHFLFSALEKRELSGSDILKDAKYLFGVERKWVPIRFKLKRFVRRTYLAINRRRK